MVSANYFLVDYIYGKPTLLGKAYVDQWTSFSCYDDDDGIYFAMFSSIYLLHVSGITDYRLKRGTY